VLSSKMWFKQDNVANVDCCAINKHQKNLCVISWAYWTSEFNCPWNQSDSHRKTMVEQVEYQYKFVAQRIKQSPWILVQSSQMTVLWQLLIARPPLAPRWQTASLNFGS